MSQKHNTSLVENEQILCQLKTLFEKICQEHLFVCFFCLLKIVQQSPIDGKMWKRLCDVFKKFGDEKSEDEKVDEKGLTVLSLQLVYITQYIDVMAIVQKLQKTKSMTRSKVLPLYSKEWCERGKKWKESYKLIE